LVTVWPRPEAVFVTTGVRASSGPCRTGATTSGAAATVEPSVVAVLPIVDARDVFSGAAACCTSVTGGRAEVTVWMAAAAA
jgi:hypothetical protein